MKLDKIAYSQVLVGPGGRKCPCCSAPSRLQKKMDHKAARKFMKKYVHTEVKNLKSDN